MTPLARIVRGPDGAPTLVLLHGITGSAVSLAEAIDHWVARGYRVVAVDARGHGLSPRWTQARLERAGEVLVEDLIAVLEDLEAASRGRAPWDCRRRPPRSSLATRWARPPPWSPPAAAPTWSPASSWRTRPASAPAARESSWPAVPPGSGPAPPRSPTCPPPSVARWRHA